MTETAITLDFSHGIDRKTLARLRDRFLDLNRARYQRASEALGARQQVVLQLLPLILHGNHPALPGYLDAACPHGIAGYEPGPAVLGLGRRHSRSFQWRSQGKRTPDIEALFIMGSPGTIAHASDSDLDVWLCHRDDLPIAERELLQRKARALSDWAAGLGLELHIFLLSGQQLRAGRVEEDVDAENCGSAQHYLLLDEFYRTAIHLAGRYPLWWLIPAEHEANYDALADWLRERRFIKRADYIDLGSVPRIPPAEFLGAGVWQLYKGIDAPWKAILKLLLIESYASAEAARPLALTMKEAVYAGQTDPGQLDPYILLYRFLEDYLQARGDSERLALVRKAFYLKIGLNLGGGDVSAPAWRRTMLQALVEDWDWDKRQLHWLDNRHQWRVEDVQRERRVIVAELTRSYRFLSRLARQQGLVASIQPRDIALLGRKLYAAFQRKAGKVEQVNPNIAPDLGEENLAFHHASAHGQGGTGWRLYRDLARPDDIYWQPVIKRGGGLLELLAWCHCNGLLTPATRLNLQAGTTQATVSELRALIQALDNELPAYPLSAARQALLAPARPLQILLFINVGVDPLNHLTEQGMHKLSERRDALGYSNLRENLVATLDVVTLSSWREVTVNHYERGDTLLQYLQHFLAQLAAAAGRRPRLTVHCYCAGHANAIARRVEDVFNEVSAAFFPAGGAPAALRYVLEIDQRFFILQFIDGQPRFVACQDLVALCQQLALPQSRWSPVILDSRALAGDPAWHQVCRASRAGVLQVFFEMRAGQLRLWFSDETGALFHWHSPCQTPSDVLAPLLRFLGNVIERRQLRGLNPAENNLTAECLELVRDGSGFRSERRSVAVGDGVSRDLDVQAIGRAEPGSSLCFDLYCDDREFSALEHGPRLAGEVAAHLLARRGIDDRSPVCLTDLHLSPDLDPLGDRATLSTAQYIRYKVSLEQSLNSALDALYETTRG